VNRIQINNSLSIPEDELVLAASRSGGPGGQNVNKVSTRVMLRFDVAHSPCLSEPQRARIAERLHNRLTRDGVLVLNSQQHRTQPANRAAVIERFAELLRDALRPIPVRKKTRPPRAVAERRLEAKRLRSRRKQNRRTTTEE